MGKRGNRCRLNPVRELHFLRLLADHHNQYDPQQDAREDQHSPIRQSSMRHKGEDRDNPRKRESYGRSPEDDSVSKS